MATRDDPHLEPLDKVRLVLDYAPAEALESVADDEEEFQLLASLDERIDRRVVAHRVRDATVVVERPMVVELLGVTCGDCGTLFEIETDEPLPRPAACPSCGAEGTVEAREDAAAFTLDGDDGPAEAAVPGPEPPEEEGKEPAEAFHVPEPGGNRRAVLVPHDDDEGIPSMEPAVDPVTALTPDVEEDPPEAGSDDVVEDILAPEEGAVETTTEEDEEEDDEYTFTPPTAQEQDEGDEAVQDLLDEDFDLDVDEADDEEEGEDEERGEAFDDVEWPEEVEDGDEAFSVVAPADADPQEAPDPEEELVEPDDEPEEGDWPGADPVEDDVDEPEWPELEDDDEPREDDEPAWPELEDEEESEGGDGSDGNPGNPHPEASTEEEATGDEVPNEWAGRDLEDDEASAAGTRGGLPLDQLPGVQSFYADQLAASGYETTADLVVDDPWSIADETGIASALVKKWQRASALVQELGMGAGYASVLAEAEEGGPDDLRGRDPRELADTVNELLGESDLDLEPVTEDTVAGWIGGA